MFALDDKHQFDHSLHASRLKFANACIMMADELQNDPSTRRLVPDELAMLQEETKRQEMSQRGQRGGQSRSKSSIGRCKKREKKQKEKEPQFNNSDVINLDSEEEADQTHQYSFGHQGRYSLQS